MFEAVYADAKAHAIECFPQEACGIVVADAYIPCENVASNPEATFVIASETINPYIIAGTLQAVIHSHPFAVVSAQSTPSASDMRGQMDTAVPWGIIDTDGQMAADPYWLGDHTLDEPLLGVTFHHGVRDCGSAIRKWFWQKRGIKLADFPRDDKWWLTDANLYVNSFEAAGFVNVTGQTLQDGDVLLGKVNSTAINHAAVYLDNPEDGRGLLYHHLPGRLSRREAAGPWINRAQMVIRYNAD